MTYAGFVCVTRGRFVGIVSSLVLRGEGGVQKLIARYAEDPQVFGVLSGKKAARRS